ncbi:MAG: hypothetical protein AAFX99_07205 [Myxococcota bacterium]
MDAQAITMLLEAACQQCDSWEYYPDEDAWGLGDSLEIVRRRGYVIIIELETGQRRYERTWTRLKHYCDAAVRAHLLRSPFVFEHLVMP